MGLVELGCRGQKSGKKETELQREDGAFIE